MLPFYLLPLALFPFYSQCYHGIALFLLATHHGIAPLLLAMLPDIAPLLLAMHPWRYSPFASNAHWHCSPLLATHPGIAPLLLAMLTQQCSPRQCSPLFFFLFSHSPLAFLPFASNASPQAPCPFTVGIAPLAVLPSLSVMLCQPVSLVILQQHYSPFPLKVLLLYVTLSSLATVLVTRFYRQSSTIIVFQATLFS